MFADLADRCILFPRTGYEDANGAARHEIAFDGGQLEILSSRSPGVDGRAPDAHVLTFTGNAARAEWTCAHDALRWQRHAVEVWTVNYPGYGASTGPARLACIAPAALAAYDHVARIAGGAPILLAGSSLGAAVALHVAANRPAAGMILHNPPPLRQLILGHYGWWNLWLAAAPLAAQVPAELDALANAQAIRVPALFAMAEHDEIVPLQYQRQVAEAYAGPKRQMLLPQANHNTPMVSADTVAEFAAGIEWLWHVAVGKVTE